MIVIGGDVAGFGVAMGNAIDECKEVSDHICGINEEDGVACFIEEFVLGVK